MDEKSLRQRGGDPGGERHHAPDQPGKNVARGAGAGRPGLPRHLRGHRQPHAARRCAGRHRHRRGRPGGRERDAGPRLLDAPARDRGRAPHRPAPGRHHRHRRGAGAHRVLAQGQGGGRLPGVLRRGRAQPHLGRPRHHLQHGARIRRHRRAVRHRRADAGLPAPHGPLRQPSAVGRNLRQGSGSVGRQPARRPVRAHARI